MLRIFLYLQIDLMINQLTKCLCKEGLILLSQYYDFQHNDTQHNDTQHNDNQHNGTKLNDKQHYDT